MTPDEKSDFYYKEVKIVRKSPVKESEQNLNSGRNPERQQIIEKRKVKEGHDQQKGTNLKDDKGGRGGKYK